MFQKSANRIHSNITELMFFGFVKKRIFAILKKRNIAMHTGTIDTINRFRHKCCMKSIFFSNWFYCKPKSGDIISCSQNISIFKTDFMLPTSSFMVACFNFKPHILKRINYLSTNLFAFIIRTCIIIIRRIICNCSRSTASIFFK